MGTYNSEQSITHSVEKVFSLDLSTVSPVPVKKTTPQVVKVPIAEKIFSVDDRPFPSEFDAEPDITAPAAYVMDIDSKVTLYQRNASNSFSVASTAKLMTALVSLDTYTLDEVLTVGITQTSGDRSGLLRAGDKLTVEQLLHLLLIQSANDAAVVLAYNHPQGVTGFVDAMNAKAQLLSLTGTHFNNPIGFDNAAQYSTARDLALLADYAIQHSIISDIVAKPTATVTNANQTSRYVINSTNLLLADPRVVGVKTGTTTAAKEVLITRLNFDQRKLLYVVIGSSDRFGDTLRLIDWTFSWFEWHPYVSALAKNSVEPQTNAGQNDN